MEELENLSRAIKRKKRRTRKCLDELRNRSRSRGDFFTKATHNEQSRKSSNRDDTKKNKNFITLNRLTLAMFPKAVRSETITRPILAEINEIPKLNISVEDPEVFNATSSSTIRKPEIVLTNSNTVHSNYTFTNSKSISDQNHNVEVLSFNENIEIHASHSNVEGNTSNSFILFSPMNRKRDSVVTPTILSPQSSHEDYGYLIYEELMAEIPTYLKENTATLIKEESIKRTRALLHRLYIQSCHQEHEDNIAKCMNSNFLPNTLHVTSHTCTETIIHHPMDYIRLEYQRQLNTLNRSLSDSSHSPLDPHSPLRFLAPQTTTVIQDTPEYIYYPHRLNQ